jgi:hypothetical protein
MLAAQAAFGCERRREPTGHDEPPHILDGGQPVPYDAGPDAPEPLPRADMEAPAGWHRWPFPPEDCAIFVPDDIATVAPLPWEPCPFMPDGCTRATAPWGAELGWGYGDPLRVAVLDGSTYIGTSRRVIGVGWWEALLLRDNIVLGAWRVSAYGSQCTVNTPWIDRDGRASTLAIRQYAENAPHVYLSAAETLMTAPERTEVFGPPDAAIMPTGPAQRSDQLLVVGENFGRFAVRDLATGATYRPVPPESYYYLGLLNEVPIGDAVAYFAWTGTLSSIWIWSPPATTTPLLLDPAFSYDYFVTDGVDAAWTRSQGQTGEGTYETVELWSSPLATSPAALQPKKVATLPEGSLAALSIGDGWIAAYTTWEFIRIYRISDGLVRLVPHVDGLCWNAIGQYDGLIISGGAVWLATCLTDGPGNDIRFITRFEIDKLPTP